MSDAATFSASPSTKVAKPRTQNLTEPQRRAIVADLGSGLSVQAVADKYNINRTTVWRLRKSVTETQPDSVLGGNWRVEMRTNAVKSVNRALTDDTDPYKAGNIGVSVLKGLGDFAPDQGNVNVVAMLQAMPAELKGLLEPAPEEGQTPPHIDITPESDA